MSLTTGILFPRGNIAPGGFKFNQIRKVIQILIFQVQLLWNHIWFQYCVSQRKRTTVSIMDIKDFQTLHFIIGIRKVQGAMEVKVWKEELENQEKSVAGNSEKQSCQPTEVGPQRRHLWGGLWAAAALMLATASVGARTARPRAPVGIQGQLSGRQAACRAEEIKNRQGPTGHLCVCLTDELLKVKQLWPSESHARFAFGQL